MLSTARTARPRPLRARVLATVFPFAIIALLVAAFGLPVSAHQMPNTGATGSTGGNTSSTKTLPSGLTTTFTVTGGSNNIIFGNNLAFNTLGAPAATMYTPQFPVTSSSMEFDVAGTGCPTVGANSTGLCTDRGTLTISFSRPVTNPILHFSGLGGNSSSGTSVTASRVIHVLTGSSPAGATLTMLPNAVNMSVIGNTIDVVNASYVGTSCSAISSPTTQLAGCGSVRVNGTVSSVTFRIDLGTARLGSGSSSTPALDGYMLTVSVDEDFGDAPASYDPTAGTTGAASHMVGALRFGNMIDADNTTVLNPNTPAIQPSPNAVAAGADNNGGNGDGAEEDGLSVPLPGLHTGMIGQAWTLTPSLSNVTSAARVCGWVDFNRNGVFDNPSERACADVAAGATSAVLSWTVPVATTAGRSYVRLRVSHDVTGVQNPTGRVDSGEVEDYMLEIKPAVRVIKSLSPADDPGRFDLQIAGTTFAATAGHNGTTDFRTIYHNSASNAPDVTLSTNIQGSAVGVTVGELAAAGTTLADYATTYSCQNGLGTTVASGTGTLASISLPASVTGTSANGRQQAITCTFTNTKNTIVRLQKSLPSGRAETADQFSLSIAGPGGPVQVTTTGAGSVANGVAALNPATAGASYTLSESPSGMPNLDGYVVNWNCANTRTGGQTPSGSGSSFSLTPVLGDDLTCTFVNSAIPRSDLSITKNNTADAVLSGSETTYVIVATNNGPANAHGALLQDPLPVGMTCHTVTCTAAGGAVCPAISIAALQGGGVVIDTMPSGGSLTLEVQCTID